MSLCIQDIAVESIVQMVNTYVRIQLLILDGI